MTYNPSSLSRRDLIRSLGATSLLAAAPPLRGFAADKDSLPMQLYKSLSEDQIDKILQPDELPPGVIQLVKVYLAEKRKIAVGDKMEGEVKKSLRDLAQFEVPKKLLLVTEDFTVENGLLTPTLKVKRRAVEQRYANQIEALYAEPLGGEHDIPTG